MPRAKRCENLDSELFLQRKTLKMCALSATMLQALRRDPHWTPQTVVAFGIALLHEGRIPTPLEYPDPKVIKFSVADGVPQWISYRLTQIQTDRAAVLEQALAMDPRFEGTRGGCSGWVIRLAIVATWLSEGRPKATL